MRKDTAISGVPAVLLWCKRCLGDIDLVIAIIADVNTVVYMRDIGCHVLLGLRVFRLFYQMIPEHSEQSAT